MDQMSHVIYHNVLNTETEGMDRKREEMTAEIYESGDDFRTQTTQSTGHESMKIKCYRSVTVCLVLLCVLLLTAVIVLCVLINTNNQQFHIKTKNLTRERDQLLTKYTNITEERDQLLTKYTNNAEKRLDGWIYYQSLYFISSEKKSWTESRRYCRERGADLIIINNKQKQDLVSSISGTGGIWIGLSDSDVEGRWKWVDGSTLSYSFWGSGEPNGNEEDEDCVMFYSLGWADYPCTQAFQWICEKNIFKI